MSQITLKSNMTFNNCNPAIQINLSQSAQVCVNTRASIALDPHSLTFRLLDEIALYDRQIRLWGVKAQERYGELGM